MIWMTRNHIIRQNEREVIDPLFLSRKTNKIYTSHLMSQDYMQVMRLVGATLGTLPSPFYESEL